MSICTRAGSTLLLASLLNEFNSRYHPETARAGQCMTCTTYIQSRFVAWLLGQSQL